ncbi:MAG: sensor histidine kinase [Clostridiales bacterium]|nr:sensor histidine kinase [Clostridiales bacterium]
MNATKRMTSTARRFSRAWMGELFWRYIWLDIVLIVIGIIYLIYSAEKAVYGMEWSPYILRRFAANGGNSLWQRILGIVYSFQGPDGLMHEIAFRSVFESIKPFGLILLCFEGISWICSAIASGRKTRRLLRPLDEIAKAARELSMTPPPVKDTHVLDEEKFHDLEAALNRISPGQPGEKLHTGDRDLEGLEDAINDLLQRVHESYQQQARFVSDASHELRTPIAVIQGYVNMLARWGKEDEKVLDESIAALKSESDYMKKLVEQLLFLARGDIGKNHFELQKVSLSEVMKEAYEECLMIDQMHEYHLKCDTEVFVLGDAAMLKQCVRVFTDNAAKYTPEGGEIFLRAYENAQSMVCFEIQDSGIGMKGEDVEHIFERFYRSDPARDRNSGGTGLGLSIAKWIVDRHSGHIEVLSREGIGTRFTVCLPAVEALENNR